VHQVNLLFYQRYKSHISKVENLNLLASKIIKITKKPELQTLEMLRNKNFRIQRGLDWLGIEMSPEN
jgi:hypothetical protein